MILENFPQTVLTKIKIGFLGFRVLSGHNIRKFVIKVHFIYLSFITWAPSACLDDLGKCWRYKDYWDMTSAFKRLG